MVEILHSGYGFVIFSRLNSPILMGLSQVQWAEQQYEKLREKRDLIDKREETLAYRNVRYDDSDWNKEWYLVSLVSSGR